jgi:hypothetical protein
MANLNIPKDLSSDEATKYLVAACEKFEVKCPPPQTTTRLLDKVILLPHLFKRQLLDKLSNHERETLESVSFYSCSHSYPTVFTCVLIHIFTCVCLKAFHSICVIISILLFSHVLSSIS